MIPDAERIVSDYLRSHAAVAALDTRVVSKTPGDDAGGTAQSWVRVTQLDAQNSPQSRPEHLIDYLLQIDSYAGKDGGKPEASLLNRTVRAALDDMPGVHDGVVVTSVKFTNNARLPDSDFKEPRERYVLTTSIHMHAGS